MGKRRAIETLFLTLLHHLSKLVHMYTDDSPKIYPYFIISFQKKHFFCVWRERFYITKFIRKQPKLQILRDYREATS